MLPLAASLLLIGAGIAVANYVLLRKWADYRASTLSRDRAALQEFILIARQESERLEELIQRAAQLNLDSSRAPLAAIENLADPHLLDNPAAIAEAAARMPLVPRDIPRDLFEQDHKALAIARLADQGQPPDEISRRLGLPLGEIELLLSVRSA